MLDTPEITQTEAQSTAIIRLTIPRDEIRNVMGPGITELMAVVAEQGIGPTGPWYSHHLRTDPDVFDFEIGVPVSGAVSPTGRVIAGSRPAARVVRTVYHGPYEGMGEAWGAFDAWIAAEVLATGPDFWECYLTGPESGTDASSWRTELSRPLTD